MSSLFQCTISVCLFAGVMSSQTLTEYDSIKQSLLTVQQRALNSLSVLDAASRPANWQSLITADMSAAATAASAAASAATASTAAGRLVSVPAGASLQAAINAALPGDTLVLQAGATYTGLFMLPAKTGSGYVTITTSAAANLPTGRVTPASAVHMPKIVNATGAPAFIATAGAHHYKLTGLEITCASGIYCNTLVQVGTGTESTEAAMPYAFELDRLYVHGSSAGGKRGIQLNGKSVTVRNSHVSGFFSTGQETAAIGGWNTPGPLTIDNNYLEASSMGILIGGADPGLIGVTPSDIEITRNHISRPLAWREAKYVVKNLLELKVGRRVKITGNVLENVWVSAQVGYAFNIKQGTENVKTPAITTDVLIADNVIRRAGAALVVSAGCSGVTFRNNLLEDVGPQWGTAALFAVYASTNVVIENNTAGRDVLNAIQLGSDGAPSTGLVFRANIVPHGQYGVKGGGTATGLQTLNTYFPGAVYSNNVSYGSVVNAASYPPGNYFPSTIAEVGFTDPTAGKYALSTSSPYLGKGIDGKSPGIGTGSLQ